VRKLPQGTLIKLGDVGILSSELVRSWRSVLNTGGRPAGAPPTAWPNTASTSLPSPLLRGTPLIYEFYNGRLENVSEKDRFKYNGSFIPTKIEAHGGSRHCVMIDGKGQLQLGRESCESAYWGGLIAQKCCMEKLDSLMQFKSREDEADYKAVRNYLIDLDKDVKEKWKPALEKDIGGDKENDELLNQFNECLMIGYVGQMVEIRCEETAWDSFQGRLCWAVTNTNLSAVKMHFKGPDNFWRPTFEMRRLGNGVKIKVLKESPVTERYPSSLV
jgi:hypothetical protein